MVAALSLGLGFGLQEIFANFVSGLIILFEKPIRLGDTVTIRELTGTVTKIKTRATTIVDWDRKDHRPQQGLHHRTVHQLVAVRRHHPGTAAHPHRPDPGAQKDTNHSGRVDPGLHPGTGDPSPRCS